MFDNSCLRGLEDQYGQLKSLMWKNICVYSLCDSENVSKSMLECQVNLFVCLGSFLLDEKIRF